MASETVKLETVARLRELIAALELELGLDVLSPAQQDVLYAVRLLCDSSPEAIAETSAVRRHPILETMSQPTFHRALRVLLEQEHVAPAESAKTKRYVIGPRWGTR